MNVVMPDSPLFVIFLANWYFGEAEPIDPPLCGNSSGAG